MTKFMCDDIIQEQIKREAKTLAQTMDQASLEILEKHQPGVIAAINAALDNGDTARKIKKALFKRFGTMSLTAALAAGAAHYLEAQRKAN